MENTWESWDQMEVGSKHEEVRAELEPWVSNRSERTLSREQHLM